MLLFADTSYAQNLSAGAQNAVNRLEREYFPSLGKIKSEIESQRSTIASAKCNEYIERTNRAVGVWNSIPKSELRNPKLSPTKK